MAGSRTGTPTIIKLARKICRLRATWGASNLAAATTAEFASAIAALAVACAAFEALDDQPAQIDSVEPFGPEDIGGA